MVMKLTYNDIKEKIENDGKYKLISKEYINCKTKMTIKHLECNKEFEMDYNHFRRGQRCSHCCPTKRLNTTIFRERIKEIYGEEFTILGEYKNNKTKISTRHNNCGYIWDAIPYNLLENYGCPKCGGSNPLNTKIFKERVKEIHGNEYTVLGEYVNKQSTIRVRHNNELCNNYEWDVIAGNFIYNRTECPICSINKRISKGEKRIKKWLEDNNYKFSQEYKFEDCKYKNNLRFDFAVHLENELILIEYDGRQHFFSSENKFKQMNLDIIKERDLIKNKYCQENNIKLLRISYKEFHKIEEILFNTFNDYPKAN